MSLGLDGYSNHRERSRSRSRTVPSYSVAHPTPQAYRTTAPKNIVLQREVHPVSPDYETKTPRNHGQYSERSPVTASGNYAARHGPQYRNKQPVGTFGSTSTSLPRDIQYDIKTPAGATPEEFRQNRPQLNAYVESVIDSDDDSDYDDRTLRRHSSVRSDVLREPHSPNNAATPLSSRFEDQKPPLHRHTSVHDGPFTDRHSLSQARLTGERLHSLPPRMPETPDVPRREDQRIPRSKHGSIQGIQVPTSYFDYNGVSDESPRAHRTPFADRNDETSRPPTAMSPYGSNIYREVRPTGDLRRYSSHTRRFDPQSPSSPHTPQSPQFPMSPVREAPKALEGSIMVEDLVQLPKRTSLAIRAGAESPRAEIGEGKNPAYVEMMPPEQLSRRRSTSTKDKSEKLVIPKPAEVPKTEQQGLLSVAGTLPVTKRRVSDKNLPPPSPLLEAYKGTYQTISPMPSPMMQATALEFLDDPPPLSPSTSTTMSETSSRQSRSRNKSISKSKHAKIYDASADADALVAALNHSSGAKSAPLVAILPVLTHDQILELKNAYKRRYRVAGHGVNISKHIKSKTTGNFGKVCYIVSLGRWESEAYWANFWYQSQAASRELLIESLMGRTNSEISAIKQSFRDKRYNDSLTRCMEKELKADKFRKAVLMALEEKKQEDTEFLPVAVRNDDVEALNKALLSKDGGESAIIAIVIGRSDAHLREVLKTYEITYGTNFAREALKKSNNLVGELFAHVLNGIINKPVRDALLINHAITDVMSHNPAVQLRHDLLISRLVRIHWDRAHLVRVREEYAKRYGGGVLTSLERDIGTACKGEYGEFCVRLCET